MKVPVGLVIAEWALLIGLGLLVVVLYRQLGRALHRPREGRELGPPVGTRAVSFSYASVADRGVSRVSPGDEAQPVLLAFVDPTCPSCERLVEALGVAETSGELADTRVLLLMSDPPAYVEISEVFQHTTLEIGQILEDETIDAYRASATPLLVAIDAAGTVQAAGSAVHISQVRAFHGAIRGPAPVGDFSVLTVNMDNTTTPPADSPVGGSN